MQKIIEALLFYKGEPMKVSEIARILEVSKGEVEESIQALEISLSDRGVTLVRSEDTVTLGTAKEASEVIEKFRKDEVEKDLTKASLETLTIILYRGPISRSQIDYIRGVNSSFILRNLMIRGLVERSTNKKDAREYLYNTSLDLLQHLGLEKKENLPEYAMVQEKIETFLSQENDDTSEEQN